MTVEPIADDPHAPALGHVNALLAVGSRQRAARNLLTQRIARVLLEQLG